MKKRDEAELFDGCFSPLITDCVSPFGVCVCVCVCVCAFFALLSRLGGLVVTCLLTASYSATMPL